MSIEENLKDFKNRESLIKEALEEFSTNSFKNSSLNHIIKKANVSKGSFYFHFRNKKELYLFLFGEIAKMKKDFFSNYFAKNPEKFIDNDLFAILRAYMEAGINFTIKYPQYNRLAMNFYKEKGNPIYEEVKNRFSGDFDNIFKTEIEKAIVKGVFRKDFDSDFITRLVSYLLINFDHIFPYEEKENFLEILEIYDKYIDFIKFGLADFSGQSRVTINNKSGDKTMPFRKTDSAHEEGIRND